MKASSRKTAQARASAAGAEPLPRKNPAMSELSTNARNGKRRGRAAGASGRARDTGESVTPCQRIRPSALLQCTDEELAGFVANGCEEAWSVLYARSAEFLRGYATQLGHDADAVDDLVQETLLRAWARRRSYDPARRPYRSWLRTILYRQGATLHRRAGVFRRATVVAAGDLGEGLWRGAAPADTAHEAERREERQRLRFALAQLTRTDQLVLEAWAEGEDPSAIARRTGLVPSTVRGRLYRARRKLAEVYTELYG